MSSEAERYAAKVMTRHVPYGGGKPGDLCRYCHQREPSSASRRPVWPCDARKLAILVLQHRELDELLGWRLEDDEPQEGLTSG